ncbi:MAG: site-specific DNA-methyltransferase [Paenibacillus macerans]|uniref:site-specific DNA-methyltransferase n=1 Tax=Paenibacillus TaxID=44249 RepID=UPI000EDCCE0C|nr:site-specific DNA-methyltransferase [Paenibacillus macerans]MDU7472662.1 site-specific DNA-methyltransferase [Paenibacillus macerans]GBK62139.1 site-specific DNA-methyltransferase [Paenibacillus macerans]GBK68448.1 site-specific DNA-methyltransferase [Paenibacillus macerans]
MNKLTMKSVDLTQANIDKIAELFPNVITEARDEHGKVIRAVDFDLLKQELSDVLVEGEKERYQLTWPGKKQAILNANTPTDKTLRPVKEDSVDWDNTQNLYIEGDNLEVLKLLQESYLNKIKCIYIDPPYNTGNDFIYRDDFRESIEKYLEESGQLDEYGNRLVSNQTSNGRFHSDWLTMMYSRLHISRSLLKDDGVIFISIDDNELHNLRKICDEVFGKYSFIGCFVWKRRTSSALAANLVSTDHEYVLAYGKNPGVTFKGKAKTYSSYKNPDNDPRGPWMLDNLTVGMTKDQRPNQFYDLVDPKTGRVFKANPNRVWAYIPESMQKMIEENRIYFPDDESKRPMLKRFMNELKKDVDPISTLLTDVGMNSEGTKVIKEHFDIPIFNYAKPTSLLKQLFEQVTDTSDIILDFFSGSATTAEAVLKLNSSDNATRKFIMVQVPEAIDETAEAQNLGLKNICEIGKERIRRAAKKIKEETGADIDYGFRVFRVDSSNMKDVFYTPDKLKQGDMFDLASNIKEDRSGEDLLIQVMLELGLELSLPMETKQLEGKTVHYVAGNSLIACFDDNVPESVMKQIAAEHPLRVVFRDSSFEDDSARINVEELFKMLSPSTEIQVL